MFSGDIACFDVFYRQDSARAAAVVFRVDPQEKVIAEYCLPAPRAAEYQAGEFYRRELPYLLLAYSRIKEDPGLLFVDGYAWLGQGKKGLGAHLHQALGERIPVIGVAKTYFRGCDDCVPVFRGQSKKPLFVSSVGVDTAAAANLVKNLGGEHRLPSVLKRVDSLAGSLGTVLPLHKLPEFVGGDLSTPN